MKWLEVIKLRSAGNLGGLLEALRTIPQAAQSRGLVKMKTCRHAALETDLSVHLVWETERVEQNGSPLSHQLMQALKEFGLIDHSIWIEEVS